MYDYILFDLDGTLSDTSEGVTKGIQIALRAFGIEEERDNLRKFIGPPLQYSFSTFYGFEGEKLNRAIEIFREYYVGGGMYENTPYPGLDRLLTEIRESNRPLIVTTSKLETAAIDVLTRNGLIGYFDRVIGATSDGTRTTKQDVLEEFLRVYNVTDRSRAVLIGDTRFDAEGAVALGIDCIGVLYGFGTEEELIASGVKYIAPAVEDISRYL
ncbi:MAG: HAD hydrolase-like protein [Clostridiales bacterium]|nr:HAD hydrolase-like protein [Clostridiales bacterium]